MERERSPFIISLIRKRAELAGQVAHADAHLARLTADLAALDRVLDISGYQGEPAAIPSKRPTLRQRDEALEIREFARDMLSKATQPLRTQVIARAYMQHAGVAGCDPRTVEFYRYRVVNALRYMRRKGEAEMLGKAMGATWRIAV
jgi:hypothetical protein